MHSEKKNCHGFRRDSAPDLARASDAPPPAPKAVTFIETRHIVGDRCLVNSLTVQCPVSLLQLV